MKRQFEIGFIITPEISEEETEAVVQSVMQLLEKAQATVEKVDNWGRRRLAYPIEKQQEGIYVFLKVEMEGSEIGAIERRLKLNEKVIRFLILRLDDKLQKTNKLVKKWNRNDRLAAKRRAEEQGSESEAGGAVAETETEMREEENEE
jgi:small subunit ribosomal protein S6